MSAAEDGQFRFEVTIRASAAWPSTTNATVRLGLMDEPDDEWMAKYRTNIAAIYEEAFGEPADRIGVAVLPWPGEDQFDEDDDRPDLDE